MLIAHLYLDPPPILIFEKKKKKFTINVKNNDLSSSR